MSVTKATTEARPATQSAALARLEALYDSLLYVVSHDVKSPLVSISLGAELLDDAASSDEDRRRIALDAIRHGATDLERLLDAVTVISRARRRTLDDSARPLGELLAGRTPLAATALNDVLVTVDPRVLAELLAATADPSTIEVDVRDLEVRLILTLRDGDAGGLEGSPLELLLESLTLHAGTPVGALAGLEAQIERQGGALRIADGRMRVTLARVRASGA